MDDSGTVDSTQHEPSTHHGVYNDNRERLSSEVCNTSALTNRSTAASIHVILKTVFPRVTEDRRLHASVAHLGRRDPAMPPEHPGKVRGVGEAGTATYFRDGQARHQR